MGEQVFAHDVQIYEVRWGDSNEVLGFYLNQYGQESPYRHQGGVRVFFILRRETESWIYVVVGKVEEEVPASWWQELYNFGWLASGSGSATYTLYLPSDLLEELRSVSQQPDPASRMVRPLQDILKQRPQ
jgi:hypothetical protein